MKTRTHKELMKIAMSRKGVKEEYDALHEEFELLNELIKARKRAGKTQEEIAKAMKTTTSVVGRLEAGGGKHMHAPTITTLQRYAHAVNCNLIIKLIPVSRAR